MLDHELVRLPTDPAERSLAESYRHLAREDLGRLSPGARADFVLLAAPSYQHLVYRPGMPLVESTWVAGERAWPAPA